MYPIEAVEGDDGEYNIRGLKLPLKELAACEEEQLSTALGYVCHLVFMISKYLQVTICICSTYLQHVLQHEGFSNICDAGSIAVRNLPQRI